MAWRDGDSAAGRRRHLLLLELHDALVDRVLVRLERLVPLPEESTSVSHTAPRTALDTVKELLRLSTEARKYLRRLRGLLCLPLARLRRLLALLLLLLLLRRRQVLRVPRRAELFRLSRISQ
jgi:hypothetical protein